MTRQSHDQNIKNLFLDFPGEALEFILPTAIEELGPIRNISFERQETQKFKLSDAGLVLDMPILFSFEKEQLLLWLTEFQEEKKDFSIYLLSHYTIEMMQANPKATVVPTVLFTDRKKWRKDVMRELDSSFLGKVFMHFEYKFVKLFDYNARDYFNSRNPLVRILLPKMNYRPEERFEVVMRAYAGLFQLASRGVFNKYADFIDIYAGVSEEERKTIYDDMTQHKETVMLAEYIKDKGRQEGIIINARELLIDALELRFGNVKQPIKEKINDINDPAILKSLFRNAIQIKSINEFEASC